MSESQDAVPRLEQRIRRLRVAILALLLTLILVLAGAIAFGLAMRAAVVAERAKAEQASREAAYRLDLEMARYERERATMAEPARWQMKAPSQVPPDMKRPP